ncbi:hypothetical protein [Salinisphaera sp. T31B1]|uniref:hypothetical protein n=1 Tax=Salinisphaera sp. T31B1 TaxID=727963 RepID=UPI003340CBA7
MNTGKSALILIALWILIAAHGPVAAAASAQVAFDPAQDAPHAYRVAMRTQTEGTRYASSGQWLALQGVMRYRVRAGADEPTLTMHAEPRFLQADNQDGVVFSSARPGGPEHALLARAMDSGFELDITRETGATRLKTGDEQAWQAIAAQTDIPLEQLGQLILAPAVTRAIPAKPGAQVTIDHWHGMPALRLTVEQVDRDSVTATIGRAENRAPDSRTADIPVTDVTGRLRIDRRSGWITAMTLISDRQVGRAGRTLRLHSAVTLRAVDDPAIGGLYDSLRQFKTNAMLAALAGADMYLPESAADAPERREIEPPQNPLADSEPVFHIDDEHGALVLDIRHHNGENIGIDQITLDTLTLRDADGNTLDLGFVLESIGQNRDEDNTSRIRLLALGPQPDRLDEIAEVQASFTYQPVGAPTYVSLPLRDTATELEHGPAHARAVPVDDGWLVTLIGSYSTYYTYDHTTVFKGRSAITSDRADGGAAPTDQVLLDSVDDPNVWIQQYELEGDIEAFALSLYAAEANASTHELTFTR